MSYESSIHYYERINKQVNDLAGNLTCARMIIYNVNFEEIRKLMLANEWDKIGVELGRIAKIYPNIYSTDFISQRICYS